jgi:predicted DNA-binding antitoxin AbrB/MazE fold protein
MTQFVLATYEDGVLKPHEPLHLLPHSEVRIAVVPIDDGVTEAQRKQAWDNIERIWRESTFNSGGDRMTRDELHERR